ncbi:MAG TPA: hypothetical protein VEK38_04535, partial [Candidatus Bathyarchaeia archaeon]|nr:hypothetical protein [Candidatus Bathyarchaeia archaeon]
MGRYLWKIWFIVLSIFSLHASQKTVWILIHGTWAQKQPWYRVGGDFYEKLRQCLDMQKNNIISFTWNGNVRHTSRVEAARQLASYL